MVNLSEAYAVWLGLHNNNYVSVPNKLGRYMNPHLVI